MRPEVVWRCRPADQRTRAPANSYLTNHAHSPYPARVTDISRRSYFYGFFYYGFPLAGRDWRRTRE